jgi:hypothetical protein
MQVLTTVVLQQLRDGGSYSCHYSPKCLEEVISEVRIQRYG